MWPFSTIKNLKEEILVGKRMVTDLSIQIVSLKETCFTAEKTIAKLRADLSEAKKNDTPQDPKTGKFKKVSK